MLDLDLGRDANGRHVKGADLTEGLRREAGRFWSSAAATTSRRSPLQSPLVPSAPFPSRVVRHALQRRHHRGRRPPVMTDAEHRTWLERHRKTCAGTRADSASHPSQPSRSARYSNYSLRACARPRSPSTSSSACRPSVHKSGRSWPNSRSHPNWRQSHYSVSNPAPHSVARTVSGDRIVVRHGPHGRRHRRADVTTVSRPRWTRGLIAIAVVAAVAALELLRSATDRMLYVSQALQVGVTHSGQRGQGETGPGDCTSVVHLEGDHRLRKSAHQGLVSVTQRPAQRSEVWGSLDSWMKLSRSPVSPCHHAVLRAGLDDEGGMPDETD